jgi:hypothetical protein
MVLYPAFVKLKFRFVKFKAATGTRDGIAPQLKGTSQTTQFCETVGLSKQPWSRCFEREHDSSRAMLRMPSEMASDGL